MRNTGYSARLLWAHGMTQTRIGQESKWSTGWVDKWSVLRGGDALKHRTQITSVELGAPCEHILCLPRVHSSPCSSQTILWHCGMIIRCYLINHMDITREIYGVYMMVSFFFPRVKWAYGDEIVYGMLRGRWKRVSSVWDLRVRDVCLFIH